MRLFPIIILCGALSGCITNVSNEHPHRDLVGTVWEFKTDVYVVQNYDGKRGRLAVPCVKRYNLYIPNEEWKFTDSNIGNKGEYNEIIGGFNKGDQFKILRVMKHSNIEMGDTYWPIAVPLVENQWTGLKELNTFLLYNQHDEEGILNPEYAQRVDQ